MICLRWPSKSEAGVEMRQKAAAPEARVQLPGSMQDTKIFIFLFEDKMLQAQKPWQPCSEASQALRNLPPSLQPEHHLQIQCLCLPMVHVCASPPYSSDCCQLSPDLSLMSHLSPFDTQTEVRPLIIINPEPLNRNQSQVWGCWGLGFSPSSFRGENHISEGGSSDTFWEAKAAKRRENP